MGEESNCNAGHPGLIPGLGRSPGEGNVNPLQCSCLENSMDRGGWQAKVHGIARVGNDLVTAPPSPPPPKSLQMVTAAMKLKDTYSLEEKL